VSRSRLSPWIPAVLALLLFCQAAGAQQPAGGEAQAVEAAKAFLAQVDAGNYGDTWNNLASAQKNLIGKDSWSSLVGTNRQRFGKLSSRRLESTEPSTTLPGAPDGQYVVLTYESVFGGKRSALEIVTTTLDEDGKWKVLRYALRKIRNK